MAGDEMVPDDEDVDLPWPSSAHCEVVAEITSLTSGVRYINGEPISAKSAVSSPRRSATAGRRGTAQLLE